VDNIRAIGISLVDKMTGHDIFTYVQKRKDKVRTLASLTSFRLAGQDVTMDPALLFQRLYVVACSSEMNLEDLLQYELCSFPPSIFESVTLLRKADKPQLAKAIQEYATEMLSETSVTSVETDTQYVLDGGSLIHRIPWSKGVTYDVIAGSYASFVIKRYGLATIVFDGYESGLSIKDMTHIRRVTKMSPTVVFTPDMLFRGQKEEFLSNKSNKQSMIKLIGKHLQLLGCTVLYAPGDADVDIVRTCMKSAMSKPTTLVGEDTDLLVLLLYLFDDSLNKIYFRSDVKRRNSDKPKVVYDIQAISGAMHKDVVKSLLFIHAFTGSDTTSRIFNVGKQTVFRKVVNDVNFREDVLRFSSCGLSAAEVEMLGCKIMVSLFGGNKDETLTMCRYRTLVGKVCSSNKFVTPERLPPTTSATRYHSLRCYLQIRIWQSSEMEMNPCDWGWNEVEGRLSPRVMDLPPAPDALLKIIRCSCTTGCTTRRCSCRKNGLQCSFACGACQETNCDNGLSHLHDYDSDTDCDDEHAADH
jgi:hypothetical protein